MIRKQKGFPVLQTSEASPGLSATHRLPFEPGDSRGPVKSPKLLVFSDSSLLCWKVFSSTEGERVFVFRIADEHNAVFCKLRSSRDGEIIASCDEALGLKAQMKCLNLRPG